MTEDFPVSASEAPLVVENQTSLAHFTVTFLGVVEESGEKTFEYQVSGPGTGHAALNWFFLENACDGQALSVSPGHATATTVNDVSGYQWQPAQPSHQTRVYSYTFPSDVPTGAVRVVGQVGGTLFGPQALPGPCGVGEDVVTLSGSVFVDGDQDGMRGPTEPGIGDVRVDISGTGGFAGSDVTAEDGSFSFAVPAGQIYTITIPDVAEDLFNAVLLGSYNFTAVHPRTVEVEDEDISGIDVGLAPDTDKILADLTTGDFQTNTISLVHWRNMLRTAERGELCPPTQFCRPQLEPWLLTIFSGIGPDHYLLEDPYVFDQSSGKSIYQQAFDILAPAPPDTDLLGVYMNLFAMQLNRLAGLGSGNDAYDDVLMAYLEWWVLNHPNYVPAAGLVSSTEPGGATSRTDAPTVVHGGGGGGTVEFQLTKAYLGGGGGGVVD